MKRFRVSALWAAMGFIGLSAVAAQRPGARALNETMIENLDELDPPYRAYTGIDYGPFQMPPPKTRVVNITGIFVETPLECAVRCNDDDLCNAATYYGENPVGSWPNGHTCWLKTLAVPCDVPPDYENAPFPGTIFLVAQDEDLCEEDKPSLGASASLGPATAPAEDYAEDFDPLLAPLEDYTVLAPLEAVPAIAPAEVPVDALPPIAAAPDAVAPAIPNARPATPTPPGGFITDFEVDGLPDVKVNPRPPPPVAPPDRGFADAPEPAATPDGVDSFPDPLAPEEAFAFNLGAGSTSSTPKATASIAAICLAAAVLLVA